MARGGKRPGAGRKRGSLTTKTREIVAKAAESGTTPLEYLLSVLRDDSKPEALRFEAAKAAAPYIHPRLSSVEATGKDGGPMETVTTIELVAPDESED